MREFKPILSLTPPALMALRKSRATVKVMLAVEPSVETFCTIMSTLMSASARGPNTDAETPGWSLTLRMETLPHPVNRQFHHACCSDLVLFANDCSGRCHRFCSG
jgi:hypothetical protein